MIGKLRSDANLRYLYGRAQKLRGAKRKYADKAELNQLNRFKHVRQLEAQLNLYSDDFSMSPSSAEFVWLV